MLDRTVFYANSGGQPGDTGALTTADGARIPIATAVYTDAAKSEIAHVPAPGSPALKVGDTVTAAIDWDKRYARMRMHTALHLLSAVLPYAVTGGSVGEAESRLDFDIPDAGLDKDAITAKVNEMIASDAAVTQPLDQRRRARGQSRPGQDHVGEAADGHRPRAADRDRRPRSAALRRHACALAPGKSAPCG